jgi:PAS domain-containing protein
LVSSQKHHEDLVNGFRSELKEIFDHSKQGIYLYLDDTHKACNEKFASLLGYESPEEWAKLENPLGATVDEASQQTVVSAYTEAMEKLVASKINIKGKKKSGETVDLSVIMVPAEYKNHIFALHFVSEK